MHNSRLSILSNATEEDVFLDPYPHLVVRNALDKEIFQQLRDEQPDVDIVLNGREKKDTWYDYPAILACENNDVSPLWREFMEYHTSDIFFREILRIFKNALNRTYPDLEDTLGKELKALSCSRRRTGAAKNPRNYETDLSMECQFYVNFTEQPRAVRGPHVDRPTELYAALLYFRGDDDDSVGSDLDICKAKNVTELYPSPGKIKVDEPPMEVIDNKVDVVRTVKYEANTLVFFINSERSIHAVSPRTATPVPRRHVNFTGDLFNLDNKELFEVLHTPKHKLKVWLEEQPLIWRFANYL
ncbi:MAG: hypothetical protein R3F41_15490 [Gammaproteobacteria bacterium]|nr:hypothetical protein [Pseudomonadales bacterium]